MSALLDSYQQQLIVFLLVLTRIGGLVMSAPIFGPRSAPLPTRIFLTVALALIVTPTHWHSAPPPPANLMQMTIVLAREAALGLALGLALTIFFSSMHLAGNIMGQMSGMQLADVFDPSFDANMPVFGQFLDLIAIGVFVSTGGHQRVTAALLDTFRWRPPGGDDFPTSIVDTLTSVLTESFIAGIRAGAPVMISLLLAVLVLGLISRTLPQLNIFAVGFNVNAIVVLLTLVFSLATMNAIIEEQADAILDRVRDAVSFDTDLS
jgi:flagellar biosynthetic protein FliR